MYTGISGNVFVTAYLRPSDESNVTLPTTWPGSLIFPDGYRLIGHRAITCSATTTQDDWQPPETWILNQTLTPGDTLVVSSYYGGVNSPTLHITVAGTTTTVLQKQLSSGPTQLTKEEPVTPPSMKMQIGGDWASYEQAILWLSRRIDALTRVVNNATDGKYAANMISNREMHTINGNIDAEGTSKALEFTAPDRDWETTR